MFIAMNRFKVIPNSGTEFERVWTSRDTHLRDVPGFIEFHLLRGPEREDHMLYSSHTLWRSREDFEAWTRSEAFRLAHGSAGQNRPLYLGHPEFEGFEVIQTVERQMVERQMVERTSR
jgi:heme-degrading monooxygenase HmoA